MIQIIIKSVQQIINMIDQNEYISSQNVKISYIYNPSGKYLVIFFEILN